MSDIFLSYSSKDKARAQIIAEALEARGCSVWWDRVIPPGKKFAEVIEQELEAAKCVIVLWSHESVESKWVKTEASEGDRRGILVPVLIEEGVKAPLAFRLIEAAKLIDWEGTSPNPEFDLLLNSVAKIVGRPPKTEVKKPPINELNISAQRLFDDGKYSEAIDKWKEALNFDPENNTAIKGINNARLHIQREEEAQKREKEERERRQKEQEEKAVREEEERKAQEDAERKRQKARQEEEWLRKQKEEHEHTARGKEELEEEGENEQPSYKKFLIVALVLGVLLLGYWALAPGSTNAPETFTNSIGMEFVLIPAGEFDMGSPSNEKDRDSDEGPVHRVKIAKSFYMSKYEVTQKQWLEVMGTNPSYYKGDNLPVENVSWNDIQEFIKRLNEKGTDKYRLPSEAEWEYAARAGTTTRYYFSDNESKLGDYAWYGENSGGKTHSVGQKKPNSWGLYDIHGNVWEWVQDIYHNSYNGAPNDGSAWERDGSDRVYRGGGWLDFAGSCRSAFRGGVDPGIRYDVLGFRLLKEQ